MQAPNESFILAIIFSTFFIVLFGMGSFYVIAHFEKKKRKIILAQQQRESQFHQELLQAQLEMQEHTFKTISREIHDNVGQILSIIKLNLNIITYKHKDDEQLEEIKSMVTNAISELRDLSSGYYADRLVEEGFLVAIQHQLNLLEKTGLFKTSFHSEMETLSIEKNR